MDKDKLREALKVLDAHKKGELVLHSEQELLKISNRIEEAAQAYLAILDGENPGNKFSHAEFLHEKNKNADLVALVSDIVMFKNVFLDICENHAHVLAAAEKGE